MKRLPLMILICSSLTISVFAQKKTTIMGDTWVGVVESTNEATREITLRHSDKSKTETFVGVLENGYQVKLKDGTSRELKMSEIKPGLRLRLYYKSKTRDVAGRQTKLAVIHRIDFLGRDEYTQMREVLGVPPSIPVSLNKTGKLPASDPLKIYLASETSNIDRGLVDWSQRWNKEQAAKYGGVEIVTDREQADILLVVFWGTDESIYFPPGRPSDSKGNPSDLAAVTANLVTKDDQGLQVLWIQSFLIQTNDPQHAHRLFDKELEKRIKARFNK